MLAVSVPVLYTNGLLQVMTSFFVVGKLAYIEVRLNSLLKPITGLS